MRGFEFESVATGMNEIIYGSIAIFARKDIKLNRIMYRMIFPFPDRGYTY
jgi:hypothetical protein